MISRFLRKLGMAAAMIPAALLAACEEGPNVVVNFSLGGNVVDNFVYASSKGPVLVEIHGNPIAPRPLEDLAEMVLAEMKSSVVDRVVSFTVYPEEAPAPNTKIIAVFNAAKAQSGAKLCEGKAPDAAGSVGDKISLRLVYCSDGERMSDVEGWIKKPENPDDKPLRKLIWHATSSLLSKSDH